MSKFYVGQKVRVVRIFSRAPKSQKALGHEGMVNEIGNWGLGLTVGVTMPFGCPLGGSVHDWCFREDELEPITPPHEACDDAEFIASLDRLATKVEEMA